MIELGDLFIIALIVFCPVAGMFISRHELDQQPRAAGNVLIFAIPIVIGFVLSNFGINTFSVIGSIVASFLMVIGYHNRSRMVSNLRRKSISESREED